MINDKLSRFNRWLILTSLLQIPSFYPSKPVKILVGIQPNWTSKSSTSFFKTLILIPKLACRKNSTCIETQYMKKRKSFAFSTTWKNKFWRVVIALLWTKIRSPKNEDFSKGLVNRYASKDLWWENFERC